MALPKQKAAYSTSVSCPAAFRHGLCIVFALLHAFPVGARSHDVVRRHIDHIFAAPAFSDATWACLIRTIDGSTVYGFNTYHSLIPASNQKILTAAAALLQSGPDYRSRTLVIPGGRIEDGVLRGNLIMSGHGAIHFTARFPADQDTAARTAVLDSQMRAFARQLRRCGIYEIEGDIIARTADWGMAGGNPHYPAAVALTFHENTIDITVENGVMSTCPEAHESFEIVTGAHADDQKRMPTTGHGRDLISVNTARNSRDFWRLTEASATEYYRTRLRTGLVAHGITVRCADSLAADRPLQNPIFHLESPPLADLLRDMGRYSDNLRAELIFLNLGYIGTGAATYPHAVETMKAVFQRHNLTAATSLVADGSGLSRENRIAVHTVADVLSHMLNTPYRSAFLAMFPVAGQSGTLRDKMIAAPLAHRIMAKTGTLRDVKALSGYILDTAGEPKLVFSIICNGAGNHAEAWQAIESVLTAVIAADGNFE